ncbi:MAG: hypothetical protein IKN89_03730 [Oscillospiraceae bacterium]|nr:hypothetical protein [Oscillospiraceae bacterium]
MYKPESIQLRKKMAKMHDEMLSKLASAIANGEYVEASWLCYAIFEQRIARMIVKHIHKCPKQDRPKEAAPVGIDTKLVCISKLIKSNYGAYELLDKNVFSEVKGWCRKRNALVHELLDVNSYKKYDKAFKDLAIEGEGLVYQVYSEATKLRD